MKPRYTRGNCVTRNLSSARLSLRSDGESLLMVSLRTQNMQPTPTTVDSVETGPSHADKNAYTKAAIATALNIEIGKRYLLSRDEKQDIIIAVADVKHTADEHFDASTAMWEKPSTVSETAFVGDAVVRVDGYAVPTPVTDGVIDAEFINSLTIPGSEIQSGEIESVHPTKTDGTFIRD